MNLKLKANWKINQYQFRFMAEKTTDGVETVMTYRKYEQDYATAIDGPSNPTRAGYNFVGWFYKDAEGEWGDQLTLPTTMPAENTRVYAKWEPKTITIMIVDDVEGAEPYYTLTGTYGSEVDASGVVAPTKIGANFIKWSTDIPATFPTEDLEIKAEWEYIVYSYRVRTIDDSTGKVKTLKLFKGNYGDQMKLSALPTRTGYDFIGWKDTEGNVFDTLPKTMPAKNVVVDAQWNAIPYTLTIDAKGGTFVDPDSGESVGSITVENLHFGDSLAAYQNLETTRDHYKFKGWDADVPATMPANNVSIKATWEGEPHKVIFMDSVSGTVYGTYDVKYGDNTPAQELPNPLPKRDGYVLDMEDLWNPTLEPTVSADRVYNLKWKALHTVTFVANGVTIKTLEGENRIADGKFVNSSDVPVARNAQGESAYWLIGDTEEYFVFAADGVKNATPVTSDLVLNATWVKPVYTATVTFVTDFGKAPEAQTVTIGEKAVKPAAPTAEGQNFLGWFADGSETAFDFDTEIAGDITLTAHWDEIGSAKFTYNLSLTDSFLIKYTIRNLTKDPADYSISWEFASDGEVTESGDVNLGDVTADKNGRYTFEIAHVDARRMSETVHVVVKYKDIVIKEGDYSVKGYCEEQLARDDLSAALEDLLNATLVYGANVQLDFRYNTDNLPTDSYDVSGVVIPETAAVKSGEATGIANTGNRLSFEYRTEILFMVRLSEGASIDDYTVTVDGKAAEFVADGSTYAVVIPVSAINLGKDYTVKVVNTTDGTELTYVVSAVVGMYNNASKDSRKAIYNYYLAASEYYNGGNI
jgi:uncharacterized repeat protein (TIGR02543 family)